MIEPTTPYCAGCGAAAVTSVYHVRKRSDGWSHPQLFGVCEACSSVGCAEGGCTSNPLWWVRDGGAEGAPVYRPLCSEHGVVIGLREPAADDGPPCKGLAQMRAALVEMRRGVVSLERGLAALLAAVKSSSDQ